MENEKKKGVYFFSFFQWPEQMKKKRIMKKKIDAENDLGYCPIVLQERHCIVT